MAASTTRIVPRTRQEGPEKVLVIGGGATGLVTLRNLLETTGRDEQGEYPLFDLTLVERRDDVGGVWYWSDSTYELERSLSPNRTQGVWPLLDSEGRPHWPSPAYLNLKGNVLPEFLQFTGVPFPPPSHGDTFPTLKETHDYLKLFAKPLRHFIRCGIEVLRLEEQLDGSWEVELKDWKIAPSISVHSFDRVVVACGWYDTPVYPNAEGMDAARRTGLVHHAKHYRDTETYAGKKVMVVGNNNSSNEAAAHLAVLNTPSHPVYKSVKRPLIVKCPCLPDERIRDVGVITKYEPVVCEDGRTRLNLYIADGTKLEGFDYVLLGTGYGHCFPFIRVLTDEAREKGRQETTKLTPPELQGIRVPDLFRHQLYAKSPNLTLGFSGIVVSYFPFSFADLTSRWLSNVWAGRITTVPASIPARLETDRERKEYLWSTRPQPVDKSDPFSLLGFHCIAGSLTEPGPSEIRFGAMLREELIAALPEMADVFAPWDEAREAKQYQMYAIKKQWLLDNEQRIKTDPFDLHGRNNEYRYLAHRMSAVAHI